MQASTVLESAPRLEIVAGPLEGKVVPLGAAEITLGREPTNTLPIRDSSLSRQHCRIYRSGLGFRITDLESRNGTSVNGRQVQDQELRDGDEIRIGKSRIRFLIEPRVESDSDLPISTGSLPADATVVLRSEDTVYLRPSGNTLPANRRTVQDLDALLNFSRRVSVIRELDSLKKCILEAVLEIAPADRVALLLLDPMTGDLNPALTWERQSGTREGVALSKTIVQKVVGEGVAVLSNDVPSDQELQSADSLVLRKVQAVLAVPLAAYDRVTGLLYVDCASGQTQFDVKLLQLLSGYGNIAALAVENVRHFEWLQGENRRLQEELRLEHDMVGESPAMKEVFQFISRVAVRDQTTVLIEGESGTGKELVARALHRNSGRAGKPFVAINCAAITDTLLESELFGHEKGAFTGALAQKKGKLETADSGTVFLDEVGELAPGLQAKLLRVLQEREFERVGGTRTLKLDVRVIAATNRDLRAEVRAGKFREDLFYRLNVVSIKMPALRDRREDIPLLANHFAMKTAQSMKRALSGISPRARAALIRYDWPGNVRELQNAIERAVVLGSTDVILPEDLPDSILDVASPEEQAPTQLHEALRDAKRQIIVTAIDQANGNYTEAAKALGVHPNHFFRLIRTLDLKQKRQK